MEVKTIYIANDGTEFENREECLAYETSLTSECDFVQLYNHDGEPIKWNPDDYDGMWNDLYYIVIEPHREKEVEEWWKNTFYTMLSVSPFEAYPQKAVFSSPLSSPQFPQKNLRHLLT